MNKFELLKEKLYVLNQKLEMEKNFQNQTAYNADKYEESLHTELELLEQKNDVLTSLQSEIESQLNNN